MIYYISFYVLVFSVLKHKEIRFMLPILPFIYLLGGRFLKVMYKKSAKIVVIYLYIFVIVEMFVLIIVNRYHFIGYEIHDYLMEKEGEHLHSIYF